MKIISQENHYKRLATHFLSTLEGDFFFHLILEMFNKLNSKLGSEDDIFLIFGTQFPLPYHHIQGTCLKCIELPSFILCWFNLKKNFTKLLSKSLKFSTLCVSNKIMIIGRLHSISISNQAFLFQF